MKISGGALDGKTAGLLVKVETLISDLSKVRLFHTSVTRAIASWPTGPATPASPDFAEFLAAEVPDLDRRRLRRRSRRASCQRGHLRRAGPVLDERRTGRSCEYIGQAPTSPTCCWSAIPTTDEFQHQFLGLVTRELPNGDANPAYDDVDLDGTTDGRVGRARATCAAAYQGADATLRLARSLVGNDPTTFVGSDHGFAPQFLAIDASKVLVDLGLLSQAADVELPARHRRDHRQGQGLLGRRHASRST